MLRLIDLQCQSAAKGNRVTKVEFDGNGKIGGKLLRTGKRSGIVYFNHNVSINGRR